MTLHHALLPLLCCLAACAHTPTSPPAPDSINSTWEGGIAQDAEAAAEAWWTNFQDPVLDALIDDAQRRNVDLRLAAERVMGSQALRRAARAGLFPEISGEAQLGQTDRGSRASGGNQGGNASLGLSAIWEPDLSGRLSAAVRVASANVVATQADAETVRLLLLQEVASAYVDYRLQRALLRLTERTALAQEGTLRITRDRYTFGMVSSLEVSRGETLVAQTRAEHERAVENAASARYRLAYLLSTTPDDITARLGDGDTIPLANPLQVLASPAALLERRPDIRAAAARYAAAAGERDIAISARFPLLSLSGLIGVDSGSVSSLFDRGTGIASVLGSLVMPLLDFGRRQADLDAARTVYQTERDHATSVADVSARLIALFRALGSAPESPTAPATRFLEIDAHRESLDRRGRAEDGRLSATRPFGRRLDGRMRAHGAGRALPCPDGPV